MTEKKINLKGYKENSILKAAPQKNKSLTSQTGRGAIWQLLGGGGQMVIRLSASAILARILTPKDYGLFGMAILAREFVNYMGAFGTGTAIIAKKDISPTDLNTCFWIMLLVRVFMFLAAFFGAPLAALFFNEPRVIWALRMIAVTYLFTILSVVGQPLLMKKLRFKSVALANLTAVAVESLIAVILVTKVRSDYWSLVVATICGSAILHSIIFFVAGWRPGLSIDSGSFRYLMRFGLNGFGATTVNYFYYNIDYLFVGRLLGSSALGLYEFAYRIPHLVQDRIAFPVTNVVFPAFSKLQSKNDHLFRGYLKAITFVGLIGFPALGGLAAVAGVAVPLLWGNQWTSVINPLRVLCICAAIRCIDQPAWAIFNCKNRPDLPFKMGVARFLVAVVSVVVFGYYLGVIGVAVGMLISTAPSAYSIHLIIKITDARWRMFFKELAPIVVSSGLSSLSAFSVCFLLKLAGGGNLVAFAAAVAVGVFIYVAVLRILFVETLRDIAKVAEEVAGNSAFIKPIFKTLGL